MKFWDEEFGLTEREGKPVVSSLYVAEIFEKRHDNILRDISNMLKSDSGLSKEFGLLNFEGISYRDSCSRKQKAYMMTRDGFTLLVMGYNGTKAMKFKEAYIHRFNEMEQYLKARGIARMEFPELTQAILEVHEKPMHYHFSNEMDMINRIVLGMPARVFKKINNLGDVDSIRPYLSAEQLQQIGILQKADIGLVLSEPDYQKRKRTLEWYALKIKQKKQKLIANNQAGSQSAAGVWIGGDGNGSI